jgi:hypothetical protein
VSPAFGPDGALWVAARVNNQIFVAKSLDLGHSFSPPVVITPDAATLDWGPDARPKILVDSGGTVIVAYATFRDKKFNGQLFFTRSIDGGKTFGAPQTITADAESQRFIAMVIDSDGSIFLAWLDKRNRAAAKEKGETYAGAGLAFAWSRDQAATFSEARIAHDNTCECCCIAIAFAGRGRPIVLFRNLFDMSVRDHAVMTFTGPDKPGPIYRVSDDDWAIDACRHLSCRMVHKRPRPQGPFLCQVHRWRPELLGTHGHRRSQSRARQARSSRHRWKALFGMEGI